jgi:2-methylcitrate dehydratase PrpD
MDQNLDPNAETLTKTLCGHLAAARFSDLSPAAQREARRGVLDWIGCALAGSTHETLDMLLGVLQDAGGRPQATVLGRDLKLGRLDAPLANGQMGHVLDFDDTHMGGQLGGVVLHASSPILAALFSLAERSLVSGADLMLAYAAGFEAGIRSGLTAPGHHKGGWHSPVRSAPSRWSSRASSSGSMPRSSPMPWALQPPRRPGCAESRHHVQILPAPARRPERCAGGVAAGRLDSQEIIEGRKGFCRVYSDIAAPEHLTAGLGESWLIETNGHKPYACGVVLHPLIDAVIAIRNRERIDPATVSEISLRVHPLVLSITGVVEPSTGLQSKFSAVHSAAVALIDGTAGIAQYSDARATDSAVAALRRKTNAIADATLGSDEAYAAIVAGGKRHEVHIPHATGTAANPMSDAAIEAKFLANATPVIGGKRAQSVVEFVWALERQQDMRALMALLA